MSVSVTRITLNMWDLTVLTSLLANAVVTIYVWRFI